MTIRPVWNLRMDTTEMDAQDRADILRLVGGDERALDALMDRHSTSIYRFLYRMVGHEEDANDLAQETFVRVFQHCRSYKPEARFSTWLYTIAGNLARNHYRWRSRHSDLPLDAPTDSSERTWLDRVASSLPSPSEAVGGSERFEAVRVAIEQLPSDMREMIILTEWEECTVGEVARILQTTPKAVESKLYRARKLLREALQGWF